MSSESLGARSSLRAGGFDGEESVFKSPATEPKRSLVLPKGLLFHPPVADAMEPRFYAGYRQKYFLGAGIPAAGKDVIDAGQLAAGATVGAWGHRTRSGSRGIQIDLTGGVFSQFELKTPSADLLNTDFLIGLVGTWRDGPWSARLRVTHLSGHLGDEFLLRNRHVPRVNLTYEQIDGLASYARNGFRIYGGGGYVFNGLPVANHGLVQAGAEWQGRCVRPRRDDQLWFAPVLALDLKVMAIRSWRPTVSAKAGVMLTRDNVLTRVLFAYRRGYLPFSQFYATERVNSFGIELQLEL